MNVVSTDDIRAGNTNYGHGNWLPKERNLARRSEHGGRACTRAWHSGRGGGDRSPSAPWLRASRRSKWGLVVCAEDFWPHVSAMDADFDDFVTAPPSFDPNQGSYVRTLYLLLMTS